MPVISDELKKLLSRTDLNLPFENFLKIVENDCQSLGQIKNYQPINEGYEDANIKIETSTGVFVLKIFSNERDPQNIFDYINITGKLFDLNVPTLKLIPATKGKLGIIKNYSKTIYYFISEFFTGQNFQNSTPTLKDISIITQYLGKINTVQDKVKECYDSWGNKNLFQEYSHTYQFLTPPQNQLLKPIINEFNKIDFSQLSTSFIHGDIQRKHVLKNNRNQYCILDFGCMSYGPKIIDLSTFLAWFCLTPNNYQNYQQIFNTVLEEYSKFHHLSDYEINTIPSLIKASYAAYFLKTSILTNQGDNSSETKEWLKTATEMLSKTQNID
jgi:Ser/Thr protein kinase RdoA (MazF antagonist)